MLSQALLKVPESLRVTGEEGTLSEQRTKKSHSSCCSPTTPGTGAARTGPAGLGFLSTRSCPQVSACLWLPGRTCPLSYRPTPPILLSPAYPTAPFILNSQDPAYPSPKKNPCRPSLSPRFPFHTDEEAMLRNHRRKIKPPSRCTWGRRGLEGRWAGAPGAEQSRAGPGQPLESSRKSKASCSFAQREPPLPHDSQGLWDLQ